MPTDRPITRRNLLQGLAIAGVSFPLGWLAGAFTTRESHGDHPAASGTGKHIVAAQPGQPLFPDKLTPLKLAWLSGAYCVAPVPLAKELGIFRKYNLDVELLGYDFHTPHFLASPANGESDAAVTMLHNWLFAINDGVKA